MWQRKHNFDVLVEANWSTPNAYTKQGHGNAVFNCSAVEMTGATIKMLSIDEECDELMKLCGLKAQGEWYVIPTDIIKVLMVSSKLPKAE